MRILLALILALTLCTDTHARRPLRHRNNGAGVFKYWSPGFFLGLVGQNSKPRLTYRGDWIPR